MRFNLYFIRKCIILPVNYCSRIVDEGIFQIHDDKSRITLVDFHVYFFGIFTTNGFMIF